MNSWKRSNKFFQRKLFFFILLIMMKMSTMRCWCCTCLQSLHWGHKHNRYKHSGDQRIALPTLGQWKCLQFFTLQADKEFKKITLNVKLWKISSFFTTWVKVLVVEGLVRRVNLQSEFTAPTGSSNLVCCLCNSFNLYQESSSAQTQEYGALN